jgi:uncharacterized protein (TIGR02246 family)
MASLDEMAVRDVLDAVLSAWNDGDAIAIAELFDEDADYITAAGTHSEGRDAIEELHRILFDGPYEGTRLDAYGADQKFRFATPDTVIVVSEGALRLADEIEPASDRLFMNTTVLVRREGRWLITAFQNTRVQEEAP